MINVTFSFEPDEDDLNNVNEEFDFEPGGYWELHINHKFPVNCYCGTRGTKQGVWCDECVRKFWEAENAEIQKEYYESLEAEAQSV
jgi:hypothetical protein